MWAGYLASSNSPTSTSAPPKNPFPNQLNHQLNNISGLLLRLLLQTTTATAAVTANRHCKLLLPTATKTIPVLYSKSSALLPAKKGIAYIYSL